MDYNNNDIIIARATPIGRSALAIIRLSGNNLTQIIQTFFATKNGFTPNLVELKNIKSISQNIIIDSCMIVYYKNPKSFTGEDMLEIFCHGNDVIVENIINEFIEYNVRVAYPGEFSYRAFKNGKIDLMQAESIAEKINQNSNQYGVALQNLEKGVTSQKMQDLRNGILNLYSIIEHELDFNEEEITHLQKKQTIDSIKKLTLEVEHILNWSLKLQKIEKGYKVMLLGVPNAGKSTLFNRLLGKERAIVTDIKGTTRDVLECNLDIHGVPFVFYDTAGFRKSADKIETLGINKTKQLAQNADFIIMLDEANPVLQYSKLTKENKFLKDKEIIFVKTKCDNGANNKNEFIEISCLNDLGIDALLTTLLTKIDLNTDREDASNLALCNMRQINLLKQINFVFKGVLNNLNQNVEMDIIASQLREAIDVFEELLGKMTSNEILNNIFKGFCVGK
jgi:tRNA modification GTPase